MQPNPLARHPLKEKRLGPAAENLGGEFRLIQVQKPLEHGHGELSAAATFWQRPGDHARHGGLPAPGDAACVGREERNHAAGRGRVRLKSEPSHLTTTSDGSRDDSRPPDWSHFMGVKKTGKGRRKLGQKKRRMRARIRHRKG